MDLLFNCSTSFYNQPRVLLLEKDLVFYKIDEDRNLVTIYAVVDQRQEYLSIIRGL